MSCLNLVSSMSGRWLLSCWSYWHRLCCLGVSSHSTHEQDCLLTLFPVARLIPTLNYQGFQQVTSYFIVFEYCTNHHLAGHNYCYISFHIHQFYNPTCSSTVLLFGAEWPRTVWVIIDQFYSYAIQVNFHISSVTNRILNSLKYTLASGIFTRQVQCYLLSSNFILTGSCFFFFHY